MKIHTKFLTINSGRVFIFSLSLLLTNEHSNILNVTPFLILISFLYLAIETFFEVSESIKIFPFIVTAFDIAATMIYCYLTGLCSVFYGAFIYITAICALNPKNKQAEFSVALSLILQIVTPLLVYFHYLEYINLFFVGSKFNESAVITTIAVTFIVNIFVYSIVRNLVKKNYQLLCNIIPESILPQLQENKVVSQSFACSTIVFTDFVSFTEKSKDLEPEEIVKSLEYYFNSFDAIVSKHSVEKLKTIGDGYMYVSGIPEKNENHRENAINAAIDILKFCIENTNDAYLRLDIRIGICTGAVMAAVIGKKKFQYDVWGSTVNLASRLESNAIPNSICITADNKSYFNENEFEITVDSKMIKGFEKAKSLIVKKRTTG